MNKLIQLLFSGYPKENYFKLMILSLFLMFSTASVNAQTYKTHYIAPAPWQYWSSANEIIVSTNVAGTSATVKKSDGTLITTLTPTPGTPAVYRFSGDPVGLAKNSLNTILNGAGIIVTGNNPIAVNVRNIASDDIPSGSYSSTNDQYIKGNASLFSFGDAAIGNTFRVGYYRDGDLNGVSASVSTIRPVYSVLAIENNTTVKVNGTAVTTLNAGQSYILQAAMGSLVETSGPAVMNTGINVDAPEACGDGAYNPVPPVSSLGNEYVVIRGKGNKTAEQTTVIATEANTNVTVMNFDHNGVLQSTNSYNLIAEGSFITFPNGIETGTGTGNVQVGDPFSGSRIVATKNVVAYSGTANQCEVDIATLAPLNSCGGSLKAETAKFRANNLTDLPYFAYLVTKSPTDKIYLTTTGGSPAFTNTDIETIPGVGTRRQLGSTGAYAVDFDNANIGNPNSFFITSNSRLTVAMVQSGGGFSMSNFLSPFPEKAGKPTYLQSDCASALLSADPNSTAPYQWYFNGVAIAGATSSTYRAAVSGSYTITSMLDCGVSSQSLPVTIALCNIDLVLNKTVDNASPAKGATVNFTVTVKNSDVASGAVSGTGNAIGVSATDILPSGYTYVSNTTTAGTSYDPTTGLWSIGSMASGQTVTLTIKAIVKNSGNYTNTATVTGPQSDPVTSNNTASASVTPVDIVLTSGAGTDAQSICVGGTTTAITYLITGTPVVLVSGLGSSGLTYGTTTSGGNTILTINSGTVSNAGTYNYTVTATYTLPSTTITTANGSITVRPAVSTPVFAAGATSSRCQGAAVQSYTATASNTTGITYSISPATSGVINASTGSVTWSANYNGTATITAVAASPCGNKTATHTVTINSTGTISGAATVCSGSNGALNLTGAPATVVRWESSTDNINWTAIANTSTTLNYTNIPVTTTYRAIVSGNGCTNAISGTATVTVTPRPVIANQTYYICKTGSFNFSPVDVPNGTTYTWSAPVMSSANITGGTAGTSQLAVNQTLTNSGTALETATYTVTPTYSGCSGNAFTITVYVVPTLTASASGTTACSGSAFSVTPASNVSGTTYSWTAALVSGTATGFSNQTTPVSAPVSQVLSNTSGADATVRYTVTPNYNGCTGATFTFDVLVRTATPAPTASNQTFCEIANATVANLVATGANIKWYTQAIGGTALASTTALTNGTYYASQTVNSCESASRAQITVTITATPAPTASNQTFCQIANATVANLVATGTSVKWYTQATGGTALASTTALTNGTYYASQTANSCESASRAQITVTITATPAPTASNQTFCEISNATVANLTATGTSVKWYTQATGGTALASTTALTNGTYYASQTANSCESASRAQITVTITATPAPTASNQTFCEIANATVANLTASGTSVKWYTQATGGTALASTTALTNGTYYASQTANSCESASRAQITVTITATPAPTASNQTFCEIANATVANLIATGTSVKWYTQATGGTALASTTALTNGTYYASQTANSCESASRAQITVTITATPAPTASNQTFCEIANATVANLAATGTLVKWYTQATGGTALASTTALTNGTYYASQTTNSCESASRAQITVTITATPAPTASNQTFCEIANATVANLIATGTSVKWYTQATGGTALASTTALTNGTYYASQTANSCESASRAQITVTITATPAPTASNQTFCEIANATVANLTASGTSVKWYTQATGGTALASTTALTNGTYYASQTANSCESASRTQITVTIYQTPKGFNDTKTVDCTGIFTYNLQTANVDNTANGGNAVPASFTWTVGSNSNVTGAANGSGNTINQTLINTSNAAQTITYTVTPKATVAGACVGNSFTVTVNVPVCSSISIVKVADVTTVNQAGNTINYTVTVANTGNANQTNVVVSDPLLGGTLSNPVKTGNADNILEKGETWTYSGSYTVAQADLNNNGKPLNNSGKITNTASVQTTELPTAKTATADVNITLSPAVTLVKTGTLNLNGNTIAYVFTVKNTGNVTLNNLAITDSKVTGPITLATTTLAPGASTTANASYTITAAEKVAGSVSNMATVTGKNPLNGNVTDVSGTTATNDTPTVTATGVYAANDEGTLNAVSGGVAVADVLLNDKLNGNQATLTNVTITQISSSHPNISINPATGEVKVLPNTPVGDYTLVYQIEDKANPGNVKQATVIVHLVNGAIVAVNDNGTANSVTGGTAVANVLGNDTYNNGAQANLANVTITNGTNDSNGKVTLDPATGAVSVAANTSAGVYTLTYTITDKLDASKTSTATVKVTVASGAILAKDDSGTANSVTGGTAVANVLANDNYNGTTTAPTLADVTITNGTNDSNGKVTLDPATGAVSIAANTPAGVYTLTYTITDKLDASKTSTATVKVTVASGAILAKDDAGSANSVTGGTAVANVLANDNYNGTTTAPTLADVTITNGTNDSNGKVTLDPATGAVSVAANTPAGVYTLTYTITDKLDASKTSTATVKVTVASGAILAKDDAGSANSVTGGTAVTNVLANDNYNGTTTAPTLADVIITNGTNDSNGKLTLDPATGAVSVASNTPAGVYTLTYTITDKLDASKTSTATVKVTVASGAILAKDDSGTANSVTGGTAVANVLSNDSYNGTTTAPTLADVTITNGTNDSNGKVTLNPATGAVSVAANTPAGVYTLTYTITDKLDASKTSTATVKVTVASGAILAKDDAGSANSVTGGTAVANVLSNDTYNGTATAPTLADVTITNGTNDSNGKVTLDPATGAVSVAANTPAGVYTLTYTITDKLDATKTSTATVKVTVASGAILAKDDAGSANSVTGGTAVANVLANDNYNGTTTAPTLADVTITNGTNNSNGKVTLDPATGAVSVAANTPAGVYTLTYTITDKLDASKTSTATVKVTVASGAILAKDDAGSANSVTGGTAVVNVLANDNYNGTTTAPTLADVTITNGTNDSNGKVTLDPATGAVSVAANTPAGVYTLTYTITDKLDASKTSTATVKVTVASGAILAKDDAGSANSVTGGTAVVNVLANDNYNGTTTAPTLADVTITNGTNDSNGKVTLDPATGAVSVAANTPAGVYTLTYTITDKLDASKTSTATVKVTVASGAILAKDDAGSANSVTGGTAVANVLANDNYNGTTTAPTLADVTITNGTNDSNGKVTLDPATGVVSVATNTPAGVYTLTYTITDKLDATKTSTATVKVTVASGAILAKDDAGSANSVTGGTAVANVLANDTYNGTATAPTLADVTITNGTNDSNGKVTLDPATGAVSVAANTPAGVYTLTYTITDKLDATKTSTATVKVTVASGAILAKDDAGSANSVTGGTAVVNVLANDNYNGTTTAPTLADVTITNGTNDSNGKVTLDPATGAVSVAANTPAGVYTLTYTITDKLDASKTSTATVKVTVASGAILAKDDAGSANSVTGGTAVVNVLANDNYNGTTTAPTLADVTITNGTNDSNGKVTLDPATGAVSVAANTPAGVYTLTYTITDKLDASKTSTATVKVTVASGAILAKDDAGSANSVTGGTAVANVLGNDTYNNGAQANLANVTITNGTNDSNGKVTLDPATGAVSVAANTPAGVYTLTYTITDKLDASKTSTATVKVTVASGAILAKDDAGSANSVTGGTAVANVLSNDTYNGTATAPTLADVTITNGTNDSNGKVTLDPATGAVSVAANTPAGVYTLTYTITDKLDASKTSTATVKVTVASGAILAKDDAGSANSVTGGTAVVNVLANDNYNGSTTAPTLADVTITNGTNDSNGKVTLDPATGAVSVVANTPAGVYTLTYTITDKLDASKTSTATVKVTVASGAILAKDDAGSANSVTGGTAVTNVLANDNYNGTTTAPTLADVTITNGTNDSNGKVTLDPATGAVSVAANTPAGVYTLTYTITDKLDATKTSTATVKVTVASGAILAKDDAGSANSVSGGTAVANVLANDNYNGTTTAPTLADVTITNGTNDSNGKVTLDPATGAVSVAANTPAGIYTLTYTITDKLDATKTSTATVKVTVASGTILAKDDTGTANSVTGGTAVANVLSNDSYNGTTTAPTLADVTITNGTNDSNGKVTLDPATGAVSVAANTPAGVYTLTYTITDKLDATKTSTATVKVTVASGAILAKDDAGTANSVTGGTAVANVLSNDTYNGTTTAPTLADVTITNGTNDSNGKVTLDPATGAVSVAANTPAGVYTLTYTITDKLDASKTSTATVKVTVASGAILAKDDAGSANSVTGGTAVTNVLANDNYNGTTTAPTLADVTITNGTNDSNGKVTLDPATGAVSAAANTPAGVYTLTYTITDKLDASKTSTATVKVTVASGAILAKDDAGTANSVTGGTAIANVLSNDTYNGTATAPTLADVTITNGTNDSNGKVTLDPATGAVSVAANTPAGVYTLTYTFTDKLDAGKTSTATVKVTVASGAILAKDDAGSANSVTGGTAVANVLSNDTYNGTATAPTLADVTITNGTNDSNGKVTLDPATGAVSVAANTPAGVYTLTYTITDKLDASKTSTATVKVTVASGAILAKDDAGTANSVTGGTAVANVLSNDTYNGTTTAPTLADVTITNGTNDSNGKVTLDPATGAVSVAVNTPAGVYTLTYTITDKLDATKTSTATVKVTVASGAILAKDDAGSANSVTGGTAVANVLSNDTYNGTATAPTLADVTITNGTNDSNGKVTLDPATGAVSVAANTPAGVYTLTYTITDKLDAGKTSTATVKVTVASGAILAKDDAGTANSVTGGTAVANVLSNDTYNGTTTAPTLADVTITNGTNDSNGKVTLDPATGAVSVAVNTPAGVYTLTYTITDKLDATKTSTATVKVTVASGAILAKDDAGSANSVTGGTAVANVLSNDTYNGTATAPTLADVTITNGTNDSNGKVTLDPATGAVSVAANTPAGVYTLTYTITDKLDATKTSTATVKVTVASGTLTAKDDTGSVNGLVGGTPVANVLANDTYNGTTAAPGLSEVTLSQVSTTNPNVTLNTTTGEVNVKPNTPAGVYTIVYEIADKLDPAQTRQATVTITVTAPAMLATNDAGNANGFTGGTAVENVLVNDTYNGNPATLADVKLIQVSSSNPNVSLDVTTGKVNVAPNTPAGTYTLVYQIEDKLNPAQTRQATVTITVTAPAMVAINDAGNANGFTGGTAVENVLVNDTYNGNPATLADVKLTQVSSSNPNVSLDVTTGKVNVAPNTPAGTYTLVYQIEDKLNPGQTKTATVTITVGTGAILAKDDAGTANGFTGGTAVADILVNDLYNAVSTATTGTVSITQNSTDNPNINIDVTSGNVNVAAKTLPGVYNLTYTITDKLDATKTSTAKVVVTIPDWSSDLQISKTANVSGVETSGNISYTIKIKNNGPATVLSGKSIGVTENLPAGLENITYTATGGVYSATGNTFTLSADLLTGDEVSLVVNGKVAAGYSGLSLVNQVSLTAPVGTNDPENTNNQSSVTTPLLKGGIALVKTGALSADGNQITYTFTITNTGDVTINDIVLVDSKLALTKTLPGTLAAGASLTYNEVYTLTQSDKDAGKVSNTASVTAKTPASNTVTDISGSGRSNDTPTETPVLSSPSFTFTKVATSVGTKAGESIDYTFTITNTGSTTLSNLVLSDAAANAGSIQPASIATLAPGASINAVAKHTLTQSEVNSGSFTNQATVKVTDSKGNTITQLSDDPATTTPNDPTVTKLVPSPAYTLTKAAANTATKAGDVINYNIIFKNTGNVTLTDIALTDANADAGSLIPANISRVLPGETVSISAKHTVKQSDVNAGGFSNQVNATAKDPQGNTLTKVSDNPATPAADDATFSPIVADPSVRFTKLVASGAGVIKVIEYSIQVTNTGNITLTNIVVTDPGADAGSITPAVIAKLEPAETAMILARHTLTQPEIDYGKFVNQASLTANYGVGNKLAKLSDNPKTLAPDDPTVYIIPEAPGLTLVKTGALSADGNTVSYTFTAKNTGNVTLGNFNLVDAKIPSTITFTPASIAPGETAVATVVYTITQAEKNVSSVSNTATLTASTPAGNKVTDISGTAEDNDSPTVLELPRIASAKTVTDANNNSKAEPNEVLTYSIVVRNNGTTNRTGVKITDQVPANTTYVTASADKGAVLAGNVLTWSNLSIPANGQVVVTFKVIVDAALPSGVLNINNIATVVDPANIASPLNPAVVIPTEGKLEGSKSVTDNKGNKDGKAQANEVLTYALQVRNTGGSALNGVTITDELPAGLTYVPGSVSGYGTVTGNSLKWTINMQPNSSTVLTFDAKVAPDVNSYNTIKNVATMTAPNGTVIKPEVIMDVDKSADLVITKELMTKGEIRTGSDVTYKITVTNKGANKATGVTVTDRLTTLIDAPKEITVTVGTTTYSTTTRDFVWLVGSLDLNQSATLTFKSRTLATGILNNSATVKADQPDPVPNNNTVLADAATISGDDLLIPNLFTPNGDGINDTFEINGLANFAENELTIVNRWGNEVYRAKGYQNSWTGEGLNEGTYYYLLRVRKSGSSELKVFKGYITLIRAFKN
ncbi:DUF7507 domain-containing protein [Pedobacter ghigonis]|uniref:DUF7507 domain-containing protein n=1 Tax=Pedobacter ghigonis TaxID=2730403 RepID=UPI00158E9C53|nr:PKD-like domain-containing protein [Pedobacter ghigonis]